MIRRAESGDIAAIAAIELACFGTDAWSEALVRDEVSGDRHTVVVDADLQAYGAISVAGELADLDRIAVLPSARGRGLARGLLDELIDHARDRGAARLLLEVAADNTAAIGLYDSVGFGTISRRARYYPGGVDALVLELTIEEYR